MGIRVQVQTGQAMCRDFELHTPVEQSYSGMLHIVQDSAEGAVGKCACTRAPIEHARQVIACRQCTVSPERRAACADDVHHAGNSSHEVLLPLPAASYPCHISKV